MKKVLFCITKMRYEEKRIFEYLISYGIKVDILTDTMDIKIDNIHSYDLAVIRCLSQSKAKERAYYLEKLQIKTVNSYSAIDLCTNKLAQSILFKREDLPIPDFTMCESFESISEAFDRFNNSMVIKPISSSWGRGIALINSQESLEAWIAAVESTDIRKKSFPLLVQEVINKKDFDIRVVIVGKKAIAAIKRVSTNSWKTNTHLGAEIEKIDLDKDKKLLILVNNVINTVGRGIYGLDIFYDFVKQKYLICEINHNPEFVKSHKIHGIDVAEHIAKEINTLLKETWA